MSACNPVVRDAIAASVAATEAAILAERMRAIGAWHAWAALERLALVRRLRAGQIRGAVDPRIICIG